MVERTHTLVNSILLTQLADYKQHFLYIRQLWNSPWGYGGSLYGLLDGISFEIGKIHIVLTVTGIIVTALMWGRLKGSQKKAAVFIYSAAILASAMTTFKSQFIWDAVSFLHYLQFPWRFLVFCAFTFSAGGVLWLWFISDKTARYVSVIIVGLSLIIAFQQFIPKEYVSGKDDSYISEDTIKWEVSKSSYEFMYKDVDTQISGPVTLFAEKKEDLPKELFKVKNANITIIKDTSHRKEFEAISEKEEQFILNRSYFPGWKASVNGEYVEIKRMSPAAAMSVTLPPGNSTVVFTFTNTPIRIIAEIITVLSLLLLIYFIYIERTTSSKSVETSK
jgi:hypothetical protein